MKIRTKLNKGLYTCFATVDGYDHSFTDPSINKAQGDMRNLLFRKYFAGKINTLIVWEPVEVIRGCSEEEINLRIKRDEVISNFKSDFINENYNHDPAFRSIVELLIRGANPWEIIEQLINDRKRLNDQLLQQLNN